MYKNWFFVCFFIFPVFFMEISVGQAPIINPVFVPLAESTDGRVNCIFQDKTGFIWIGKETGLYRFDGYEMKVFHYNSHNPASIGNDNIQCIAEDALGNLWIGTKGGGLNRYNRKHADFTRFIHSDKNSESIAYNEIFTILPDGLNLWIGTDGGGLDFFESDSKHFTHYNTQNSGLISNKILAVVKNGKDILLGTWDGGLHTMDGKSGKIVHIQAICKGPSLPRLLNGTFNVFRIEQVKPGVYWLATWGQGLLEYNASKNILVEIISSNLIPDFRSITKDGYGNIWAASVGGLVKFPAKSLKYDLIPDETAAFRNTSAVFSDYTSTIWIGTEDGAIGKIHFSQKKFNTLTGAGLSGNITLIQEDKSSGNIWIASGNALFIRDKKGWEIKKMNAPYNDILSAYFLKNTDALFTASSDGLAILNKKAGTFSALKLPEFLQNKQIWVVYPENDSVCWVGALGLACKLIIGNYSCRLLKAYPIGIRGGISASHYPACFLKDRKGNMWIGTYGGGLNLQQSGKDQFGYFNQKSESGLNISDNYVECLLEDRHGNIWIGTHNGLNCYNPGKNRIEQFNISQGLQNSWISSLAEDKAGNIWMGTRGGLSCLEIKRKRISNYDSEDGLPSNNFMVRAAIKDDNDVMWFGSAKGVVHFSTDSIQADPYPARIILTHFNINNETAEFGLGKPLTENIETAHRITLNAHQSDFSFYFSALHYANPKKNRFMYQLKGYDNAWQVSGGEHVASYKNVPSGKYVFVVRASNEDGIWSASEASIEVIIKRDSLKTWIIISILILIGGGVYWFFIRKRKIPATASPVVTEKHYEVLPTEVKADSPGAQFLQKALKIVEEHISDPDFGVDEFCAKLFLSRPQIYRKIHANTGLSVTEFIKDIRLKRAAQLLKQNPGSISEIAYQVGFNDPKYFSKCFKQKYGVSPAHFSGENERFLPPQ